MASSPSSSLVDFCCVLTESHRILTYHSRHFLALSLLFILPISFALSLFPTRLQNFQPATDNPIQQLLRSTQTHTYKYNAQRLTLHIHNPFLFYLVFSALTIIFSLLSFSSITHSVHQAFYGRTVKIQSSLKAIVRCFIPLLLTLSTAISGILIPCLAIFGFIHILRLPSSTVMVVGPGLTVLAIYLFIHWILAGVIVVVENKWGVRPLMRSKELVRGMRWVAMAIILGFGLLEVGVLGLSWAFGRGEEEGSRGWVLVVQIVITCSVFTVVWVHGMAAVTVLYMYCKALHGELAGEIAQEFAEDYVSLPFDEHKVPHVVYWVY